MSLDGGYIGSLDHAIANLHVGRHQGRAQGMEEGFREGYQQGFTDGKAQGWDAGIAAGNVEINKAMGFIRQHVAEKEQIKATLQKQQGLIQLLNVKISVLEQENVKLRGESAKLRSTDSTLRELVDALKGANQRLQDQVMSIDEKLQERTKQYADQLWQYNRSVVFMNAVRGVLEDLTSEKTPQADHVRELFAEKYAKEVSYCLKKGGIKKAPETDSEFAKALPRTHEFIVRLLGDSST